MLAVCHQLCDQGEIEYHSLDTICPHGQLLGAQWAELLQSVCLPLTISLFAAVVDALHQLDLIGLDAPAIQLFVDLLQSFVVHNQNTHLVCIITINSNFK